MIEAWMIIAVYVATPLCFVVGFTLGKGHVRRLASVTAVAFGYYAAMRQVERLARIDPPETPELFERDRAQRADQPLTPADIDRIDEWEE